MNTLLLPLYLRREPTTDSELKRCAPKARRFDVVAYASRADAAKRKAKACWSWYQSKPTKRRRRVTLNCWQWRVVWLPDLA